VSGLGISIGLVRHFIETAAENFIATFGQVPGDRKKVPWSSVAPGLGTAGDPQTDDLYLLSVA
jgi:hypothetical protein